MDATDTIVALSSAAGESARQIIRLSGPRALSLLADLAGQAVSAPAAVRVRLALKIGAVRCWIYTFRAPNSYTTDDLAELHVPGNRLLGRRLIDALLAAGARPAEPGEFTARAFLNGRIDLAAAEGVQLTIAAQHAAELRAARQLMAGELAHRLAGPMGMLAEALTLLEAGIDFAEEEISFIQSDDLRARIGAVREALHAIVGGAARFEQLTRHPRFVLMGCPNAGKSTLLNALSGVERAVVSPVAGTTRDALTATIRLDGGLVEVVDTAGFETAPAVDGGAGPQISAQMQARAARAIEEADFIVHVVDVTAGLLDDALVTRAIDLVVLNKIDLCPIHATAAGQIAISARDGVGLDSLRRAMNTLAFGAAGDSSQSRLALTARHRGAIAAASTALSAAREGVDEGAPAEMVAFELRHALDALGDVLGQVTPDEVIGRIFASFCIGK